MSQPFEVVGQGADHVTLRLTQSLATLAQYPFPFTLEVTYRLAASGMEVTGHVRNPGYAPMPYAFGLHPGFRWPLAGGDKAEHRLVFDAPERAEVPVIAPGGLFSQQMRPVPVEGRTLALDDELFAREALCFLGAASRGLTFEGPEGLLRMEWEGFTHLVVWSRPGAPFLCLESWTGHGDPEGFDGDLFDKPSMIILPPGGEGRHRVRYAFL
jgi:galactose mutarotase-like enzyme